MIGWFVMLLHTKSQGWFSTMCEHSVKVSLAEQLSWGFISCCRCWSFHADLVVVCQGWSEDSDWLNQLSEQPPVLESILFSLALFKYFNPVIIMVSHDILVENALLNCSIMYSYFSLQCIWTDGSWFYTHRVPELQNQQWLMVVTWGVKNTCGVLIWTGHVWRIFY